MKRGGVVLGIALLGLAAPVTADAATQIGETFVPVSSAGGSFARFQTISPGGQYAAPFAGVITSWSFHADAAPGTVKLKVGRHAGGSMITTIGEDGPQSPLVSAVNTYPTRISVEPGDFIGLTVSSGNFLMGAAGYTMVAGPDQPPGSTASFAVAGTVQMDVSALLEPDADGDGFGDETQDQCPSSAASQGDCAPPDTTIAKGPKDRTKKKTATFEFSGADARVIAGFQCSLDGGAFTACSSPFTLRVGKGKHTFSVRATDDAGNADASPATDDWKVKKKRRKKRK